MKGLFYDCPKLNIMPDIKEWILNNYIKNNIYIENENDSPLKKTKVLNTEDIIVKENEILNNLSKIKIININSDNNNNNNLKSSNSSNEIKNPFEESSYLNNEQSQRNFLKSDENNLKKVELIFDGKSENPLFSNKELLKETTFKILKKSIFEFHNNKKGCEPYIIYDKIEYNDSENINIKNMKETTIEEIKKINNPNNFVYLGYNYNKQTAHEGCRL